MIPPRGGTHPVEYTVSGRLTWEPTDRRPLSSRAPSSSFRATVHGRKWQLRIVPDDAGTVSAPAEGSTGRMLVHDYEVASHDGEWFYLVDSYESARRALPTIPAAGKGWRCRSLYPAFANGNDTLALWALYASTEYFVQRSNNLVHPLWLNGSQSPSGEKLFVGKWSLSKTSPFLPFVIDVSAMEAPPTDTATLSKSAAFPTNTALRVLESTNIGGLVLPTLSRMMYYVRAAPTAGATEQTITRSLQVIATNVTATAAISDFVPTLPDPSTLTEARPGGNSGVRLASLTTNRWPSETIVERLMEAGSP